MLNGTMDLSMTMTGASQTAIEGSALAVTSADCLADEDYYAIISEVIDNANPYANLKLIAVDAENGAIEATAGDKVKLDVYAVFATGLPKLLPYDATGANGYKITGAATVAEDGIITVADAPEEVTVSFEANGAEYSDVVTIG